MSFLEIPVGPASVFALILFGYVAMTVWFGAPQPLVVKSSPQPQKVPQSSSPIEEPRELTAG